MVFIRVTYLAIEVRFDYLTFIILKVYILDYFPVSLSNQTGHHRQ